jgi:hypothetical protein
MKIVAMDQFERPRQKPGYTLTSVAWDPSTGRVRYTKYERIEKVRPSTDRAPEPAPTRRGVVAAATQGLLL